MDSVNPELCSATAPATCASTESTSFLSGVPLYILLFLAAFTAVNPDLLFLPFQLVGRGLGWYLKTKTAGRRTTILGTVEESEESWAELRASGEKDGIVPGDDKSWGRGKIIAFYHPFCNAGGGGERVLWAAIRATQLRYPQARIVVYTGDVTASKEDLLRRVKKQFNITLYTPTITFLYLTTRHWVLPSTWPRFTLLGQSLGSLILAYDAFSLVVPDIFIDTMGYAFSLGLARLLFPNMATSAYVHYPTISTDMLSSLDPTATTGNLGVNAGQGTGFRGAAKKMYWRLFAAVYSRVGATVDVVMTNSSWTQNHIQTLWGPHRPATSRGISVVYPPCAVDEMAAKIPVTAESETKREKAIVCIAQFRPEKNHRLIIESFATFLSRDTPASRGAKLILIGSVRDDADSRLVYELRLLANELAVKDSVDFVVDAPWPTVLDWLSRVSVGVNAMWNEHFGIGVVEYEAAGLISVVHDSGGPKMDIVTEVDGEKTGFHGVTKEEFADGFEKALSLEVPEVIKWRLRARKSAQRFSEQVFATRWLEEMEGVVALCK